MGKLCSCYRPQKARAMKKHESGDSGCDGESVRVGMLQEPEAWQILDDLEKIADEYQVRCGHAAYLSVPKPVCKGSECEWLNMYAC